MLRNILRNWFGQDHASACPTPIEPLENRALLSGAFEAAAAPALANVATVVAVKALPNLKGTWTGTWTVGRQTGTLTIRCTAQNGTLATGTVTVLRHTTPMRSVRINSNGTFSFTYRDSVVSGSVSGKIVGRVATGKFTGKSPLGSGTGTFKVTKR